MKKNKCKDCGKPTYGIRCRQCYQKIRKPRGPNKPNPDKETTTPRYNIPKNKDGTINDLKLDALCERIGRGEI